MFFIRNFEFFIFRLFSSKTKISGKKNNIKKKKFQKNFCRNNQVLNLNLNRKDIFKITTLFFVNQTQNKNLFFPISSSQAKELTETSKAFETKSGLKIFDFVIGGSQKPEWGDYLVINYVLYWFVSGKLEKLDSTYDRKQPFFFIHGGGQQIKGIEEGVHDMGIGGKRRLVLNEELGFISSGLGPVSPYVSKKKIFNEEQNKEKNNKTLVFDIELLKIIKNENISPWFNNLVWNRKKLEELISP
jgi:FKBP-type peptidyl-prolyl cis-trans isomerase FkpA